MEMVAMSNVDLTSPRQPIPIPPPRPPPPPLTSPRQPPPIPPPRQPPPPQAEAILPENDNMEEIDLSEPENDLTEPENTNEIPDTFLARIMQNQRFRNLFKK